MSKYVLFASLLFIYTSGNAQKEDKKLKVLIEKAVSDFHGDIGVYVHHLKKNKSVALNADTVFPTASIVKVPILAGVFNKIAKSELKLSQEFVYDAKREYGGSGLMQFYKDSARTDLSTMISLMLTYSDNVASIWLQELAGGGVAINTIMDQLGLTNTKVNSRTTGRQDIWKKYGWGQTTPKEMAQLFTLIRQGKVVNARYSDKMYRYLKNQFYNGRSLSQIPATVNTICKTGSVDDARGEVVLVNAPGGDIVFCILTKNNKDQSWTDDNEAEILTRKLAHIIWNYYEPKHPFTAFEKID
ncbi:serine hydrolase [Niabella drilacis]|uniref:beta-lactamase n=1 Tax=Niabella drilacis (strain DSM 25811 / CCM 8410 / CCUG 62505 / LMG 26954 / E90) TaxID=1285928 RepID=A0A1G6WUT6_NIADE|nr:serine hydrolase [Niabella drilacis]SDD68957.1 beta-lactamase class A [Niabella drilacis]